MTICSKVLLFLTIATLWWTSFNIPLSILSDANSSSSVVSYFVVLALLFGFTIMDDGDGSLLDGNHEVCAPMKLVYPSYSTLQCTTSSTIGSHPVQRDIPVLDPLKVTSTRWGLLIPNSLLSWTKVAMAGDLLWLANFVYRFGWRVVDLPKPEHTNTSTNI